MAAELFWCKLASIQFEQFNAWPKWGRQSYENISISKTFHIFSFSPFLLLFLHFPSYFLHLLLRTLSTSALGLKNSEPGPMPKVLKGKNDMHLTSFDPCNILHEPALSWQWQWLPISEEVTKNILFCASIDIYCCFQPACFCCYRKCSFLLLLL